MTRPPAVRTGGAAKDQVARLLTLVPYLHRRGEVRLEDAAAALGVSTEQVLRDLRVLLMCGLPGGFPDDLIDVDLDALEEPEGDGVIRVSNADYLSRPVRLSATEASALIVAVRALREAATEDTREVIDRVLAKLEAAAAEGAAGRVDVVDPADELAGLRARLSEAARQRRQIKLRYYVASRDEESERVVDPLGIVTANGVSYLDGWCHRAQAPRLFRVDRIHEATVLDTPVATEQQGPRELSDGVVVSSGETHQVVLRLAPPAHWVAEYYPVEEVHRRRGRALDVTIRVADPRWLERFLLRLAPHATVLDPPELDRGFRASAASALGWYPEASTMEGPDPISP